MSSKSPLERRKSALNKVAMWNRGEEEEEVDKEMSKLEAGEQAEVEYELDNDPDPEDIPTSCCGQLKDALQTEEWLVRAREAALEKWNDKASEAAEQYNTYFNFSTLLLGFEGFILSDYLKNDPSNPGHFSLTLTWAVFLILWSFVVNVFISVVTLHMAKTTSAHTYEPWHRAFMPLSQWGCRFSVILFSVGINLLVAESTGLPETFKIVIFTFTGFCFVWACCIYIVVAFGPTDRIINCMMPRHNRMCNWFCEFLTGTSPLDNDLLEIEAARRKTAVLKEMALEKKRVKRWRDKKEKKYQKWVAEAPHSPINIAMGTIRRGMTPGHFSGGDSTNDSDAVPDHADDRNL
jgi:hypothetical protein